MTGAGACEAPDDPLPPAYRQATARLAGLDELLLSYTGAAGCWPSAAARALAGSVGCWIRCVADLTDPSRGCR